MVYATRFKYIPSAFLVKSFFFFLQRLQISREYSKLKVRSHTFSSHRCKLNVLAVTYVVNSFFFFVSPTVKKNKFIIAINTKTNSSIKE